MSRVLAISGSLRAASFNTRILEDLQALAPDGMHIEVFRHLGDLPHFNEDLENDPPAAVRRLWQAITEADGLIVATPEYNGALPGVLKNALDWASRPYGAGALPGHAAMVLSASPGIFGGIRAQSQLRELFALLNVYVVGGPQVAVPEVHTRLDPTARPSERLTDPTTRAMLASLLHGLAEAIDHQAGDRLIKPLRHWQNSQDQPAA
ncbi:MULTISPECIES: NADPH-dependent FMN reductase [Streptomyces]|uniref:NADPH-dependent FMN reductase n=1 Tax=Streptomyces TaxID=1883 RepID=UPI00163CD981|nr:MULTISPECIES: NAD(P)H-dependent oxidoreductase [Streptomyces]MBC2874682.1 NAD(P)H-dependent oxidoreductase [Streptomyces sp. TYQ1024]UBI36555.1 NAD(P)H-dependent oxidoreductase [Streptomyces mobaraensis]UKW29146.1 NAD(P)H-dependent oxidoreductase [Streptomyces sp. TYQ1024]